MQWQDRTEPYPGDVLFLALTNPNIDPNFWLTAAGSWLKLVAMKSAYELAMERLEKTSPVKKLTPEQLEKIQEIDSFYKAKIAERETLIGADIAAARVASPENVAVLQDHLNRDLRALREEWESRKERVRSS